MDNEKKPGAAKLTRSPEDAATGRSIASAAIKTVGAGGAGRGARVEVVSELKELVKAELEVTPAEFRQAEFSDAQFKPADFKPADFKQGEFRPAEYHPAEFRQAEFHPSEYRPAEFKQAEYRPAEYKGGEYHPAEFTPAVFVPAQYKAAAYKPAAWKPAVFRQAQYIPAEFKPAEFKPAQFKPAEFQQAEFTPSEFAPAEFKEAAFVPATFKQAVVSAPEFHQAEFHPAQFKAADYRKAEFKPADFKQGDFTQASYQPAQFRPAEFHQAMYRPAQFRPAEFKDAHIEGVGARVEAEGAGAPRIGIWERAAQSPEAWRTQVEHGVQMARVERGEESERVGPSAVAEAAQASLPRLDANLGATVNDWLSKEMGAVDSYELALQYVPEGQLRSGLEPLHQSHARRAALLRDWISASGITPARSAGVWTPLALAGRVAAHDTNVLAELTACEQRVLSMYDTELGTRDPSLRTWVSSQVVPEQRKAVEYSRALASRYGH